jgi:hypothetical protein
LNRSDGAFASHRGRKKPDALSDLEGLLEGVSVLFFDIVD